MQIVAAQHRPQPSPISIQNPRAAFDSGFEFQIELQRRYV